MECFKAIFFHLVVKQIEQVGKLSSTFRITMRITLVMEMIRLIIRFLLDKSREYNMKMH